MSYSLESDVLDLIQMVVYIQKQLKVTIFKIPNIFFFQHHYQIVIPWDNLGSMPYSWVTEALDLTQMVMDIRKQLKSTYFIIPNNFCFNNITKKSFPGTPRGQCPTPRCQRLWTAPRWSWTSGNN